MAAIDVARNRMASEAMNEGAESIFFIDADLGFDPVDALRLLARPEPVVSGVYAKKANREFASIFADGVDEVVFGAHAFGLYPLKYAATGFLRIKASVLRRMIEELDLPECNTHWGQGIWPFFRPEIAPHGEGKVHYLGEDWAFSHRLARIGVTPMADTSIRLWHYGRYGYGWEGRRDRLEAVRHLHPSVRRPILNRLVHPFGRDGPHLDGQSSTRSRAISYVEDGFADRRPGRRSTTAVGGLAGEDSASGRICSKSERSWPGPVPRAGPGTSIANGSDWPTSACTP